MKNNNKVRIEVEGYPEETGGKDGPPIVIEPVWNRDLIIVRVGRAKTCVDPDSLIDAIKGLGVAVRG